jgi:hypothetical protein
MLDIAGLDRIVSQPIHIETAMLQIKIFFVIVAQQISYLIHTLVNEVRYE